MIRLLILVGCCCFLSCMTARSQEGKFPSLEDLDKALLDDTFERNQVENIAGLKKDLRRATGAEERYDIENRLFGAYLAYELDSALAYAHAKLRTARKIARADYIEDARMNIAHVYVIAGMYKEAMDTLRTVRSDILPFGMLGYYYSNFNLLYEGMKNYTIDRHLADEYQRRAGCYKDSISRLYNGTVVLVEADRLMLQGNYNRGLEMLIEWYRSLDPDSREVAYAAYAISNYYREQGKREEEKQYLIVSALADMRWSVKEYISLRNLAAILYEEGDIDRAYTYMSRSLKDATFCNARLRTIEVTQMLPIIDHAFRTKEESDKARIRMSLVCISILFVLVVLLCFYVSMQVKKLARARSGLKEANGRLEQLNGELNRVNGQLRQSNDQLNESNDALSKQNLLLQEANNIKYVYIGKFMTECMAYIDKFDKYRITLNKKAVTGKIDELCAMLRSDAPVKEAQETFYTTFDEAFLQIFPSFVEHFNRLFPDEEAVVPKKQGRLTTELRIFALIRLGITDSKQIASFFHYSTATIYSYRSRLRLKSKNPDKFEEEVMLIPSE